MLVSKIGLWGVIGMVFQSPTSLKSLRLMWIAILDNQEMKGGLMNDVGFDHFDNT
jgi:hypothetical protein